MSGTPVSCASATAGQRLATAVPEVMITATGAAALGQPQCHEAEAAFVKVQMAAKAGWAAAAMVSGAEREPEASAMSRTPRRKSSSSKREDQTWLKVAWWLANSWRADMRLSQ